MEKCANPKCDNPVISKLNNYRLCHNCHYEWYEGGEEFARLSKDANEVVCASCGYTFDKKKHEDECPLCNHPYKNDETMISLEEKKLNGEI